MSNAVGLPDIQHRNVASAKAEPGGPLKPGPSVRWRTRQEGDSKRPGPSPLIGTDLTPRRKNTHLDEAILREASALVDAVGHSGFTVETVASAAGVHKSSIYVRWPSRVDLLSHVLADRLTPLADVPNERPTQLLARIAQHELALAASHAGRAVLHLILSAGDAPTPAVKRLLDAQRQRRQAYVALLTHTTASTQGQLHSPATMDFLLAACWGAGVWELSSAPQTARQLIGALTRD